VSSLQAHIANSGPVPLSSTTQKSPDLAISDLSRFLLRPSNNVLVKPEITQEGNRHAFTKDPFDPARMEEFRAAEREAMQHKWGLWGPWP